MGQGLELVAGALLLPAASPASASAEFGEVELAGVKEAQAIVDRLLSAGGACLRRSCAQGFRAGCGVGRQSPLIVRPSADFRVPALARGWRAPAYLQDFYFEHKLRKPRLALRPGSPARSWQLDSGGARALGLLTRGPYALPMALIDYGSKERARAVAKTAARGALTFETLASALFIAGGGLGAIESTLMAKAIAWLSLDAYDFFDDPPRADFERSTRSRRGPSRQTPLVTRSRPESQRRSPTALSLQPQTYARRSVLLSAGPARVELGRARLLNCASTRLGGIRWRRRLI